MFRKFILRNEKAVYRFLEMLPALVSFNIILFPYWGTFLVPSVVAYFVLGYNIYWFYQSLQIAITGIVSHLRIQAAMNFDWVKDLKAFPDWKRVAHIVIVPTYKEPLYILERTLKSLADQTLPKKQLFVVLAMEKTEAKEEKDKKVKALRKKFGKTFQNLYITVHELLPGEVPGKASNERYAAVWAKKNLIDKKKVEYEYAVATSCDADHVFHPNHFAALTYKFLDHPDRVTDTLGSIFNLSQLPRKDRLISTANYSLSFKLLHEVDYWDADKIPEDWGIFFKAFYKKRGGVEVEPNYLPVYANAPEADGYWKTIKAMYNQRKRWAWGVSDDPWVIKNYLLTPGIPFGEKTMRLLYLLQSHFLWPVHWFIITVGLQLPILVNPRFGRTALGYTIPRLSSIILTVALIFLLVMLALDRIYKPKRPEHVSALRAFLSPLEFFLMPIAGFIFVALPGLDAHTRLMMGRYLEYKVTEKV